MCQVVSYTDSGLLLSMLAVIQTMYVEVTSLDTIYVLMPVHKWAQFCCLSKRLRIFNQCMNMEIFIDLDK
jgi:hypothetical protein